MNELVRRLLKGDAGAAARLISLVEAGHPEGREAMKEVYRVAGRGQVIGMTGPSGVGKSTLLDHLVEAYRGAGLTVGVIAVDPSSPLSGGSFLGDRLRMARHGADPGVFIRSMASRGYPGGISRATSQVVDILDALGKEVILVETAGVGQSEVGVAGISDVAVVVLQPGTGDDIQALKAGLMEIGDLFVVNKADLPGAGETAELIKMLLNSQDRVFLTSARTGAGVHTLHEALEARRRFPSGARPERRRARAEEELWETLRQEAALRIWERLKANGRLEAILDGLSNRSLDPYSVAEELLGTYGLPAQEGKAPPSS